MPSTTRSAASSTSSPRAAATSSTPWPRPTSITTGCPARATRAPTSGRAAQPFNATDVGPTQRYEATVNAGGPIIKRKLWYGLSYQYIYAGNSLAKGPPLGVAPFDSGTRPACSWPTTSAAAWTSRRPANTGSGSRCSPTRRSSTTPGRATSTSGAAEQPPEPGRQVRLAALGLAGQGQPDQHRDLSASTCAACRTAPRDASARSTPRAATSSRRPTASTSPTAPATSTRSMAPSWYNGTTYVIHDRNRIQFDPSVSFRGSLLGRHNAKIGIQGQVRLALPAGGDSRSARLQRHPTAGHLPRGRIVQCDDRDQLRSPDRDHRLRRPASAAMAPASSCRTTGGPPPSG